MIQSSMTKRKIAEILKNLGDEEEYELGTYNEAVEAVVRMAIQRSSASAWPTYLNNPCYHSLAPHLSLSTLLYSQ